MKLPHGALRSRYVTEFVAEDGKRYDSAGCRIVQDPNLQTPRRGQPGDKLRRKGYEKKL